ncbi:unnamed protein product [Caenorhabditis sp. 36 PRJEB53466]|nr:unnamed protein product [Caenorhabditis sp. 36 PRJEB53466]
MKIVSVSGYGALTSEMQSELQLALKWFRNAFLVEKATNAVRTEDVMRRIPEYRKFSSVFVQTPDRRANLQFQSQNMEKLLAFADFSVFVVAKDRQACARDPGLLAEALPISLVPNSRPLLATMSICPRQHHPVRLFDLFRHEILHGMGYGMIIDKTNETFKGAEKYIWKTAQGGQPAARHFLDFYNIALKTAKTHFECPNLMGIEADGARKNHLNEYIFGNELMTSDLEVSGNIFSWISVGIIERTYNGDRQWYHVNRTFVAGEANQYTYGKGFGCDFLTKSCFEFIKITEQSSPNKAIGPFCSRNHRNMCYRLVNSSFSKPVSDSDCESVIEIGNSHHFLSPNVPLPVADNGVKAPPGLSYHNIQMRFCPVIKSGNLFWALGGGALSSEARALWRLYLINFLIVFPPWITRFSGIFFSSAFLEMKMLSLKLILPVLALFFHVHVQCSDEVETAHADSEVIFAERHIPAHRPREVKQRKLEEGDELLLSQVVWRHGDRAPTGTYPTDVHKEDSWPNGWGELTQLGMRQQYALGRLLYKKYVNTSRPLLSGSYNSKEVYIRSTDVNRTLVSALANLAGMFENGNSGEDYPDSQRWPRGWTPIPVHTIAEKEDPIGNVFAPCPRAEELTRDIYTGAGFQKFIADNQEFLDFVSEKSGKKVNMPEIYLINDAHYIEKLYNMSQPDWITDDVELKLRNLSQVATRFLFGIGDPYVPELIRLRGGPLLSTMIDKMNQKLSCRHQNNEECNWIGKLKYHAYSAHDTTVYAFLTTFGDEEKVIEGGMPHYTASVAVELWNLKNGGPSVRVLFHSAFHHNYHVITHLAKGCPHNSEFCPLKVFEQRSLKFLPKNLPKECESHKNSWKLTNKYHH